MKRPFDEGSDHLEKLGEEKRAASADVKLSNDLQELGARMCSNVVDLEDIRSGRWKCLDLSAILEEQGLLIINNAFTDEALAAARAVLTQAYNTDVTPHTGVALTDLYAGIASDPTRRWPTGVIGNRNFGYLFAQPESKAPRVQLSADLNVAVAKCSAYKANITLMSHPSSQLTLSVLYQVTGNVGGMISQDSCKIFRGDLTPPHVDKYTSAEVELNRVQAIAIGEKEGSVKLCFARFSHRPEIQSQLADLMGNPSFYHKNGFLAIPKNRAPDILKHLSDANVFQYGTANQLVIWKTGVLHVEMQATRAGKLVHSIDKTTTTERYVVGTHQPSGLTQSQLTDLALLASKGFILHPYGKQNQDNAGGTNSVHLKSTQWKKTRQRTADEIARLDAAVKELEDSQAREAFVSALHPRDRQCFGIVQSAEAMFDDPAALKFWRNE